MSLFIGPRTVQKGAIEQTASFDRSVEEEKILRVKEVNFSAEILYDQQLIK